ncbi:hypothetical protein DL98DRAFT_601551 [Cadophora sp. DSE1049]|nr:hypothetical protein DL98DRAFT_601551 [Cadophora sp. DSE1049]
MCITKTFVYDCGHKHLIRLHCIRNNPLLCHDLNNRVERCYYDCCCCIEYQLGVAEQERLEGEMEALRYLKEGKGGRSRSGKSWREDPEETDGESEERDEGVREWLNAVEGGHDMGEGYGCVEERREGDGERAGAEEGAERDRSPNTDHSYQKGTEHSHADGERPEDRHQNIDADGDVDMLAGEASEFQDPDYWSCAKVIEKPKEKESKEGGDEGVLEGMVGGGFC